MRVNYNVSNYCTKCALALQKEVSRCPECSRKLRTKSYHGSRLVEVRRTG